MDPTQLHSANQRSRIWIALFTSLLLHLAAVALAEIHREQPMSAPMVIDPETSLEVELPSTSPEPTLPPEPPQDPSPSVIPETTDFRDEAPTTPSRVTHKNPPPIVRAPNLRTGPASASGRALALSAPRPEYPYEARRGRITGNGIALLTIETASGRVIDVTMSKSTGSLVLDQASIAGFRRWRFKPGAASVVRCPITFTLTGAQF